MNSFTSIFFCLAMGAIAAQKSDNYEIFRRDIGGRQTDDMASVKGETTKSIDFALVSAIEHDVCFDPVTWCETELLDILTEALGEDDLDLEEFSLALNGLQAYFCNDATQAFGNMTGVLHREGYFSVKRHGNNGAVNTIDLKVDMDSTVLTLTDVVGTGRANEVVNAPAYIYRPVGMAAGGSCSWLQHGSLRCTAITCKTVLPHLQMPRLWPRKCFCS